MTYKEAIKILKPLFEQCKGTNGCLGYIEHYFSKDEEMALDLAIKALEIVDDVNHKIYRNENCPQKNKCYDYQGYHCSGCSETKYAGGDEE